MVKSAFLQSLQVPACGKMVKLFKLRGAVRGEAGVSVLTSDWSLGHISASDWPTLTRLSSLVATSTAPQPGPGLTDQPSIRNLKLTSLRLSRDSRVRDSKMYH